MAHMAVAIQCQLCLADCTIGIHQTMHYGEVAMGIGNKIFLFLREKHIWNIWTQIKWEAKLKNLSEIFGRFQNEKQSWHIDQGQNEQTLMLYLKI